MVLQEEEEGLELASSSASISNVCHHFMMQYGASPHTGTIVVGFPDSSSVS